MSATSGADDRRFFFVHMQKTGGIALFRRLRIHFGTDAVYPMPQYQGPPETALGVDQLVERFAAHREQIRVDHRPLPALRHRAARRPLHDLHSAARAGRAHPVLLRHRRELEPGAQALSLEAIYDDPVVRDGLARNHMVRMLSLRPEEMTDGALTHVDVDERRVEAAKLNLADAHRRGRPAGAFRRVL